MSIGVPALLAGLVDDAAVFPPGSLALAEAVAAHVEHRAAWYAPMVGPLLVPAPDVGQVDAPISIGLVGEQKALAQAASHGKTVVQLETAVAKRGEDPAPGLAAFLELLGDGTFPGPVQGYAEVPLTWGLMSALDTLTQARARGVAVAAKFRTGGLAAELFPTPVELAAVICACRDRSLPFKLTAGLHRAVRHTDPETGLVHHGFLNVLGASLVAAAGGEPVDLAEVLAELDSLILAEAVKPNLGRERPLWVGFGSCSIAEPLADLTTLGLL